MGSPAISRSPNRHCRNNGPDGGSCDRTLQDLRRKRLIVLERRRLTIPDLLALQGAGSFNRDYLHIRRLDRHTMAGREAQEARTVEGR